MRRNIITIGRQFGSGGHAIGEALAKKLNIPFYDEEILQRAVDEMGINMEDAKELDESLVRSFILDNFRLTTWEKAYHIDKKSRPMSNKLFNVQSAIIKELSEQGPCVIVGRCADYILDYRDDILRVFITAENIYRIKRLMEVRGMTEEEARKEIEEIDEKRKTYYEEYTTWEWGSNKTQHIILCASELGMDTVVDLLADLAK